MTRPDSNRGNNRFEAGHGRRAAGLMAIGPAAVRWGLRVGLLSENGPRKRGFALVLSLAVITLLAVAALELGREVRLSTALAGNFEQRTRARLLALDGLTVAVQALLNDDPAYDAKDDAWAAIPKGEKDSKNRQEGFEAELTDLGGRLNLNLLVDSKGQAQAMWVGVLNRLLTQLGRDPDLTAALLDWLDADDEARPGGAEKREYADMGRALPPRNGPLLDLSELGLVDGFDRDLLDGNEERPGLAGLVHVFGGGKININTAPKILLQALDTGMRESLVLAVIELREERPIRQINELKGLVGMSQDLFQAISPMLDVKSSWYKADCVGRSGRAVHKLTAILERTDQEVRVAAGEVG